MNLRKVVMLLAIVAVLLAFAGFIPLALWSQPDREITSSDMVTLVVLLLGLGAALMVGYQQMVRVLSQHTQAMHDLEAEDAEALIKRLLFGVRQGGGALTLKVQEGQVDLEGPPLVHQIGGPAYLNVEHDSAVVTSRLGSLHRVIGPGFHQLEAFERVWGVVDLRPQRRTITVEFMTRDGIPASCQATLVCRIAGPETLSQTRQRGGETGYFSYSKDAVVQIETSQFVRSTEEDLSVSDWITDMVNGVLDGAVRDVLEQYALDQLLNPQYWLEDEDGPPRIAAAPRLIVDLEDEVADRVREMGRQRGVTIDRVELGTVRPAEQTISRQWLEFWQAKLQKRVDQYAMDAQATRAQLAENARIEARVIFINRVLEEMQQLHSEGINIPPELVISSIVEVLQSMSDQSSKVEQLLLHQAETLMKMVTTLQDESSLLDRGTSDTTPQLTSENTSATVDKS